MISKALKHFRLEYGTDGQTTVWIDVAGHSMNVFNSSVIEELTQIVADLEKTADNTIVFRSSKASGFFAGADVNQIASLTCRDDVNEVIQQGQALFARIEAMKVRTVAAIHGPCLGGGLEFALACSHRIALDNSSTKLGLPEVQLGLIPGWGGTQRLPRLIGLMSSLPLILKGKKLSATAAWKAGLVDAVAEESNWESLIHGIATGTIISPRPTTSWKKRIVSAMVDSAAGRWLTIRTVRNQVARDAQNYPALLASLRAVMAAFETDVDGYEVERNEFADLIETSTSRNLLNLFQWREKARNTTATSSDVDLHNESADRIDSNAFSANRLQAVAEKSTRPIRCVGVIGAGAMGAGIGQLAALKGYQVVLKELNSDLAEAGMNRVKKLLDEMVTARRLSSSERDVVMNRVSVTDSYDDMADCDLVIEAVLEKMEVKRKVFASLDSILKPDAIIVSNTSALSIATMAEATQRADRIAGMHFFNPVHRMDLVEVVRTEDSSNETIDRILKLIKKLGKTPIVTSDTPGFLVNRVLFPYIGEAVRMVMEGEDCRIIDGELKRFGMPMGPIELIDHVGIDVAWHVATTLEDVLPESQDVIRLLGQMVAHGWTGRKSGIGFYQYKNGRRSNTNDLSSVLENIKASADKNLVAAGSVVADGLTDIQRRLVYPMINEIGFCMQDNVVAEAWMADLAIILGTGFAPFKGGPMTMAARIGHSALLNNLHVLTVQHGVRFKPSAWLACRQADRELVKEAD